MMTKRVPEHYLRWPRQSMCTHIRQAIEVHDNRRLARWSCLDEILQNQNRWTWHRNTGCMMPIPFYALVFPYYRQLELHHRRDFAYYFRIKMKRKSTHNISGMKYHNLNQNNERNQKWNSFWLDDHFCNCFNLTYFLISFIALKHLGVCSSFWYVPVVLSFDVRGNLFCELSSSEFWLAYRSSRQLEMNEAEEKIDEMANIA